MKKLVLSFVALLGLVGVVAPQRSDAQVVVQYGHPYHHHHHGYYYRHARYRHDREWHRGYYR